MEIEKVITNNEEETIEFGRNFAARLKPGDAVALYGALGAGKTEFIKGVCRHYKVEEIVSSPTFTILNQYIGYANDDKIPIYHIDLFRIKSLKELDEIGFEECIYTEDAVKLIEWAEKAEGKLPQIHYNVKILSSDSDENERTISVERLI
ncbi:MAG: tRNA threonylcarbamoyladenosine biosynthesis protein TsaE [Bacteroidota bacterium]|nr:tRNA threonylcarbamoyladenosine biosynthesis protein TsaE [Bacteroidota bacterium]